MMKRDLCARVILRSCRVKNVLNRLVAPAMPLLAYSFSLAGIKIISREKLLAQLDPAGAGWIRFSPVMEYTLVEIWMASS